MRGIREKELLELRDRLPNEVSLYNAGKLAMLNELITECHELNPWLPIENAPRDREILVYAPPHDGLGALKQICKWHESAGFCIDEFRTVTHYQELPEDIK